MKIFALVIIITCLAALRECRTYTQCLDSQCYEIINHICFSFSIGFSNDGLSGLPLLDGCDICTSPSVPYQVECITCQDGTPGGVLNIGGLNYFCSVTLCADANCQTCAVASICTLCKDGFYSNDSNGCSPCPRRCATCTSSTRCTSCKART